MENMTVAAVQMRSEAGDAEGNLRTIRHFVDQAASQGADLVCFPEASLTGYSVDNACDIALTVNDERVQHVRDLACQRDIAIAVGLVERDGQALHLTQLLLEGDQTHVYRKCHLGKREAEAFQPGDHLPVFRTRHARIGIQLCVESHIPEVTSTLRSRGAELILVPYASGMGGSARQESWHKHLPARAYDNAVFMVACNALRSTASGGGAAIYDPTGRLLASCFDQQPAMALARLDGSLAHRPLAAAMGDVSFFDLRRPELYE